MPKRENPFGDSSPLQLKSHIGKKEVDMGVSSERNMAAVYARTKDLLFEGSKKPSSPLKAISEENTEDTDTPQALKVLPGQKKIDSWGTLSPVKCRTLTSNGVSGHNGTESEMKNMDCQPSCSTTDKKSPAQAHMKQLLFDASGKLCYTEKVIKAQQKLSMGGMSSSSLCDFCDRPVVGCQTRDCESSTTPR